MVLKPDEIDGIHQQLQKALEDCDLDAAARYAQALSSARIASALREAPQAAALPFLLVIDPSRAGRVLGQLPPDYAAEILRTAEPGGAASVLRAVPSSHAVPILTMLPPSLQAELLDRTDEEFRGQVRRLMSHPAGSAGASMRPDFLSISRDHTVGQTLQAVRSAPTEIERLSYVYITDEMDRPVGVVSVRDLLRLNPDTTLVRAINPTVVAVHTRDTAVDAARLLRNRRLTMVPVVNDDGRIAGVITFDDAIDILSEEVASQVSGVAAGAAEESFFTKPLHSIRLRLPWMAANIFLNLGAVAVITGFEETIAAVAILAAFLPMITDMGGNVGIQSLSVAIRAIALGEVRLRDFWRAIRKEVAVGLVNGLVLGAVFSLIAFIWQRDATIGAIAGFALGVNVLVAGVIGGTIPFLIKRLGKDPAMMTGPILTTITDITGVSIYLGLSTLFLLG